MSFVSPVTSTLSPTDSGKKSPADYVVTNANVKEISKFSSHLVALNSFFMPMQKSLNEELPLFTKLHELKDKVCELKSGIKEIELQDDGKPKQDILLSAIFNGDLKIYHGQLMSARALLGEVMQDNTFFGPLKRMANETVVPARYSFSWMEKFVFQQIMRSTSHPRSQNKRKNTKGPTKREKFENDIKQMMKAKGIPIRQDIETNASAPGNSSNPIPAGNQTLPNSTLDLTKPHASAFTPSKKRKKDGDL